jgi:hypothetical protein
MKISSVVLLAALTINILSSGTPPANVHSDAGYLGPDRAEKLDIHLPPETFARPAPAVMFIHG